jgi:hypothetical protein
VENTYTVRFVMTSESIRLKGCTREQYRDYVKKCQGDEPFVVKDAREGWFVVNPVHLQYMNVWGEKVE